MISIAHNGQELGQFSADEVAAMLEGGQIDQTAHYWMEGMSEWRSITEIIQVEPQGDEASSTLSAAQISEQPSPNKQDADKPNQSHVNFLSRRGFPTTGMTKQEVANVFERLKAEESSKANEITDRQRAFLDYHGVKYTDKTTKAEASEIISRADQRFPDSQWNTYKHLIRPDLYEKPQLSLSVKDDLREAKQRLAAAQAARKTVEADPNTDPEDLLHAAEQVEDIQQEIQDLNEQIEDDKIAAKEGTDDISSFVDSWAEGYYEPTGEDVEKFKKVVKKPTKTQYKTLRQKLADEMGLSVSGLSLDQFLCLYVQQYPEALREAYKKQTFPPLAIPQTYQQQLHLQGAASAGGNSSTASAKKGCLGIVLLVAAPLVSMFALCLVVLFAS